MQILKRRSGAIYLTEMGAFIAQRITVDLGMATTEETDTLTALKKNRVLLLRIDISKAPDIEWPVLPGAQVS